MDQEETDLMASRSIPYRGSRVTVHCFIADVIGAGGIQVDDGANGGWVAVHLEDGHGLSFTLSGDRSSVRVAVARALSQLTPDPDPDPLSETENPEGGDAA